MTTMPRLLKLVDYHHDILRNPTEPVQFPLSQEDQQIIEDMKFSILPEQLEKAGAPWDAAVGMAANQWGINKQIFLYCPAGDAKKELTVIINPTYEPLKDAKTGKFETDDEWEACFSVPLATGNVKRYQKIRVTFQNEKGETYTADLEGWFARVWQHENDHLRGFLYDDPRTQKCSCKKQFATRDEVEAFYGSLREERKERVQKSKEE